MFISKRGKLGLMSDVKMCVHIHVPVCTYTQTGNLCGYFNHATNFDFFFLKEGSVGLKAN